LATSKQTSLTLSSSSSAPHEEQSILHPQEYLAAVFDLTINLNPALLYCGNESKSQLHSLLRVVISRTLSFLHSVSIPAYYYNCTDFSFSLYSVSQKYEIILGSYKVRQAALSTDISFYWHSPSSHLSSLH